METLKKYLPIILIAIAGIFILRIASRSKATILPQTQLLEQPYTDPNAALRLPAFQSLAEVAGQQIASERDIELANIGRDIARGEQVNVANIARGQQLNQFQIAMQQLQNQLRQFDIMEILGLKSEETELAKTGLQTELSKYLQEREISFRTLQENNLLRQFELYLQQREQDRQAQQSAINRYYSSRNTGNIVGSIAGALGSIFGGRIGGVGGNVYGTPPTFPRQYSAGYDTGAPFGIDFPGGFGF